MYVCNQKTLISLLEINIPECKIMQIELLLKKKHLFCFSQRFEVLRWIIIGFVIYFDTFNDGI